VGSVKSSVTKCEKTFHISLTGMYIVASSNFTTNTTSSCVIIENDVLSCGSIFHTGALGLSEIDARIHILVF
jgi:hypothetical protein